MDRLSAADSSSASNGAPKPTLGGNRLLVVTTGAASACFAPFWFSWIRRTYPAIELKIALTRSAERFVTAQAAALVGHCDVIRDRWPATPERVPLHTDLASWAESVVVYPASAGFVARLALGATETPVMLALQTTAAMIGVAPSIPPGMARNLTYQSHIATLSARPNVVVAPTVPGRSASTGVTDDGAATPIWRLLHQMEVKRQAARDEAHEPGADGRPDSFATDVQATGTS